MRNRRRILQIFETQGLVVWFLLIALFALPMHGVQAAQEKPRWVWTKKNPKPAWWAYDHLKEEPVRGGYLQTSSTRYIGLMNPNHWPVNDWVSMTYMYGGLLYIDGEYKATFPWLAETWEYLDPVTLVMHLRKGVQFHDGTDFDAASIKYHIDWIKEKKNGAWSRAWIEPIKSVEVMDTHTLKWRFKRPWAGFLGMMATVPGYIISQKALSGDVALIQQEKLIGKIAAAKKKIAKLQQKAKKAKGSQKEKKALAGLKKARRKLVDLETEAAEVAVRAKDAKNVDSNPVGTGRYMLEEGRPGNYLKLKRNPNWWFGQAIGRPEMPYADGYLITVIPDMSVRLANLRAGKIDSLFITPSQYRLLKKDPNLKITGQDDNHLYALRFNHAKGPCQDIRVRKAISHALDRRALIFGTFFGQAKMASVIYPFKHWCRNPNIDPVRFDPELSKKLLAEAGYADGLTVEGYMRNDNVSMSYSNAIKNMLAKVGIEWKVDFLDPVASDDRRKNMEYDLASGGWSYVKEPNMVANGLYHPDGNFNNGRSNNQKAIPLIEAGLKEIDPGKRQRIYWKLEKALYDNYEDAWLWYPVTNTARRMNLMGYDVKLHDMGGEAYWFTRPRYFKNGRR
ncbi:MAG: ABC transporter substrate-binding protein [Proteobacteria bacterium]|nr:ABC transporter substrate-binding protein [Pseudomonadota bacterium]